MRVKKLVVSYSEAAEQVGVSVSTLYRWVASGHFPTPVRLGPARVGFSAAVVEAWVAGKSGSAAANPDAA